MIHVKVSTSSPEWPLIRQTPGRSGLWGDCRFFINDPRDEWDYWVVYDDVLQPETVRCPPGNTLLVTGEPPSVKRCDRRFAAQFAQVLTCQRELKHPNAIYGQQALPWMIGCRYLQDKGHWSEEYTKDYDELAAGAAAPKTKQLSVISSDKAFTSGHTQRLDFVRRLQGHFGDGIDVFGRGLCDFEDKWDVLAPYKYHVVLENAHVPDYWTEKLSDALLAGAYPFYAGCANIGDYFSEAVLTCLDLSDPDGAIRAIEFGMAARRFEATTTARREAARQVLDEYNLFPTLARIIRDTSQDRPRRPVCVKPQAAFTQTPLAKARQKAGRLFGQVRLGAFRKELGRGE